MLIRIAFFVFKLHFMSKPVKSVEAQKNKVTGKKPDSQLAMAELD